MSPVRILIADDHAVFRRSLRNLIESRPDWRVCGEATDGEDAVDKFKELQPDIVLMDASMPRMSGLDATRRIVKGTPGANVVIVSQNDPKLMEKAAQQAGARIFVPKSDVAQELFKAVDSLVQTTPEAGLQPAGSAASEEPRLTSPPSETGARARILLADDNADMREYVRRLLKERYEVLAVADGEAALAGAREWRPHLILSGIMMPRLDGFELVKALRADESLKSIPIILLSAHSKEEVRIEGLSSGADDYLVKPFSAWELQARVNSHLAIAEIRSHSAEVERKLRLDAEMLAAIVSSSDDAIVSKDLDGFITTWNKGAERIFGYTAEEAVGQHITLIIPPERRNEETGILARLRRGERVDHFQTVRVRNDGTLLDISVSVSPLRDSTGQVIGASKVARDITKQKRAEQAVRETEERFRAMVETTPECVTLIAHDGTVLHVNSSGLRMVGANRVDMVVGKSVYDFVVPEDRQRFQEFNQRVCNGERGSIEFDIVGVDSVRRHMDTHAAPLHNPDGSVVQLAVTRDVTESQRAEVALRESEERLRALVNATSYVVFRMTPDWAEMHQFDGRGFIAGAQGATTGWLDAHVHPDDQRTFLRAVEEAVHTRSPFELEHRVRRPDGTTGWTLSRAVPLLDKSGAITEWFGAATDVSRHKQVEDTLRDQRERFDLVANAAQVGFWFCDLPFNKLTWDYRVKEHFWLPAHADVTIETFYQRLHPDDREPTRQAIAYSNEHDAPYDIEYRTVADDGRQKWIRAMGRTYYDEAGKPTRFDGVTLDITSLKHSEESSRKLAETLEGEVRARTRELEARNADVLRQSEQLRDLSRRLLRTQDEERRHIAREFHDSAGQTLTVLGMSLAQFVQKAALNSPQLTADAEMIQETVQQLSREIRTASYLLHPPLLDEAGLSSALDWYIQGLSERSGLQIKLDVPKQISRLPRDMELAVFRLVQECLTNIHRHSGSQTASIRMARQNDLLTIDIQDEGKGMSPERLAEIQSRGSGVGFLGMRERLRQFHGDMNIESGPTGTRVRVTVPIPAQTRVEEQKSTEPLPAIQ